MYWNAQASSATYLALLCYAPGLLPLGWIRLLEPLFFARQDRITPLKAAAISMVVNLGLNWLLAFHSPLPRLGWGQAGLALANTAASFANYFALAWWMRRVLARPMGERPRLGETLWKTLAAAGTACGLGAALYYFVALKAVAPHDTLTRAGALLPVIALVAVVHFGLVRLLRVPDSERATAFILGKLKKQL